MREQCKTPPLCVPRAHFRIMAQSTQCPHIYLAAGGSASSPAVLGTLHRTLYRAVRHTGPLRRVPRPCAQSRADRSHEPTHSPSPRTAQGPALRWMIRPPVQGVVRYTGVTLRAWMLVVRLNNPAATRPVRAATESPCPNLMFARWSGLGSGCGGGVPEGYIARRTSDSSGGVRV